MEKIEAIIYTVISQAAASVANPEIHFVFRGKSSKPRSCRYKYVLSTDIAILMAISGGVGYPKF
jgi:hypothetical protein